jgi:hypothetical protein
MLCQLLVICVSHFQLALNSFNNVGETLLRDNV